MSMILSIMAVKRVIIMHLHLGQAYCIQSLCDDGVPIGDSGIIVQ